MKVKQGPQDQPSLGRDGHSSGLANLETPTISLNRGLFFVNWFELKFKFTEDGQELFIDDDVSQLSTNLKSFALLSRSRAPCA